MGAMAARCRDRPHLATKFRPTIQPDSYFWIVVVVALLLIYPLSEFAVLEKINWLPHEYTKCR